MKSPHGGGLAPKKRSTSEEEGDWLLRIFPGRLRFPRVQSALLILDEVICDGGQGPSLPTPVIFRETDKIKEHRESVPLGSSGFQLGSAGMCSPWSSQTE